MGSHTVNFAASRIKIGSTMLASKFLALPILGKIAFGVIVSSVAKSKANIASAFVTALVHHRGIRFGATLSWAIIPNITASQIVKLNRTLRQTYCIQSSLSFG